MDKRSKLRLRRYLRKIFFLAYQIKVDGDLSSSSAVTLATDKSHLSQHSSSSNLLNSLFEDSDVPEDDETPFGPVKDEVDRYLRTGRDLSVPLMHHFCGGRCVIQVILGFESVAKCFHY